MVSFSTQSRLVCVVFGTDKDVVHVMQYKTVRKQLSDWRQNFCDVPLGCSSCPGARSASDNTTAGLDSSVMAQKKQSRGHHEGATE